MAGTTFTWTATTASAWTISGNWAPPGGPPAAGDTAIDPAGAILVNGGTVAAADLSIGGSLAAPLPGKGTITVTTGGEILVSDALAVWSGSTLSVDVNSSVDVGTSETFVAGNLVVENGHSLVGDGLIAASVDNLGTLEALGTVASNVFSPGTLEITGSVAGSGSIVLAGPDSIVQLDGSVSTGQTISFGTGSELILNAPGTGFAVPITNLNTGDKIEFAGLQVTSASVTSPGTITVVTKNGNYLLTDAKFAAGANQQFFTGTDPINGAGFIQVSPAFINWIGGAGNNLATGSNWQGGVAPNSTQVATLINNPGTLTGSVSALSVDIGNFNSVNTGTWTFNGTTITVAGQSTAPVGLPFAAGFNMNTVLNGGTLNAAGDTSIGSPGDATVTAQGGVQVTTLGDGVGPNAGQSGSLVLTDPGTTWTELSGAPVNGQDPGFLNFGFSGPANGLAGGAGFLTVTKSATLNTGGLAIFGGLAGGHGEGTISAGGIWNAQSVLVGSGGSGTLAVTGGALLSSTGALTFGANSGGFGAASVTGGTISAAGNVQIGSNGNGTMTIGAGGTVSAGGTFGGVGLNAGSDGYLQIVNGGVYKSTLASQTATVFNIGNNGTFGTTPAAVGSVLVSGQGSQLDLNGNPLSVGSNGGTGSLTVAQGGTVAAGTPDSNKASALQAGRAAGGTGAIIVTDPNSLLSLAGFVLLGQAGTGTLLVKNSGSVAINNAPTNGSGFFIGSGFSGGTPNVGGSGEATVTSSGQLTAQNINIGGNGSDGVLNVNSGGTVEAVTGVVIGDATSITGTVYGGTGTLNIGAGGVVKVTEPAQTNNFVIEVGTANSSVGGPTTLSDGVLNVSGVGALLDTNGNGIDVGRLGDGSLSVDQGASVVAGTQDSNLLAATTIGRLGNGSVTVSDPGSTYTANGLVVVGRGGTGVLAIENQGKFVVGLDTEGSGGISIGAAQGSGTSIQTGGSGTGLITGDGDLFSQQNISVGSYGASGQLTITTGGTAEAAGRVLIGNTATFAAGTTIATTAGTTVATATTVLTGDGSVEVGAGSLLKSDGPHVAGQSSIIVGNGAGSDGTLTVQGAGATVDSGGDRIGIGADAQGSVVVEQGGTVEAGTQFATDIAGYLGGNADGTGSLTVTDPGSAYTNVGQFDVGESGVGRLMIENQGSMFTGNNTVDATQGFVVGQSAGSTGDATVTGTNSLLSNTGQFIVGDAGIGSLTVQSGGKVITSPGTVVGLAGADVAAHAGSDGSSVSVIGTGSAWQVGGSLLVGDAADGALSIAAGGGVIATSADLAKQTSSNAIVAVSGAGSSLALSGQLTVGHAASAELSILNGATVSAADADIGLGATATGNVDIEGAGSRLNVSDNLNIGDAGVGVVTLGNNTELTVVNNLNIGAKGVLNQFGGVIDPNVLHNTGRAGGSGSISASVSIVNTGTLYAASGTETLTTPAITGTGVLEVDTDGNLAVNVGAVAATQTATFTDGTGVLTIGTLGGFAATIGSFIAGDDIIVQGTSVAATSFNDSTHVLTLFDGANATLGTLQFGASVDASLLGANASGGIGNTQPCFMAGTRISTERGEVAVEQLRVGDRVQVALGPRGQAIVWLGHRTVDCGRHPEPRKVWPVRVAAHAFGPSRPCRELFLSPDHALYIGAALIPVKHLINGTSIAQVPMDGVSYYHVELPQHSVLIAENMPAESYLDTGDRSNFANGDGPTALYPDFASRVWDAEGCAPLVVTGPSLEAARRWVNGLAGTAMQAA
jgi:T5SS/PEP-CTERM-associated repeat protein